MQYSENRIYSTGHKEGMDRALREKYVYMGALSGITNFAFTGKQTLKRIFQTKKKCITLKN